MAVYRLGADEPQTPQDGAYWIAPTATVVGRVLLKRNASVWYGAVLRGDNDLLTIGEGSNVQDNSVLHADAGAPLTIGDHVTIGHKVILHGCTVGDGSLIGMGSTLLNHSVIGANCIVGANSLITEGKVFPDNSLIVGSPARVMRTLTPEQVAGLKASAESYVENWRRHASDLKLIAPVD